MLFNKKDKQSKIKNIKKNQKELPKIVIFLKNSLKKASNIEETFFEGLKKSDTKTLLSRWEQKTKYILNRLIICPRLQFNDYLSTSISCLNVFNDVHREIVGGAKMGRQIVMRFSTGF